MKLPVTIFFLTSVYMSYAQTDTLQRLPDTVRTASGPDPESWYNSELPADLPPAKDSIQISVSDLPEKMRHTLNRKDKFNGWRSGQMFYDPINKHYKLFLRRGKNIERFLLDANGNVLAFKSFVSP